MTLMDRTSRWHHGSMFGKAVDHGVVITLSIAVNEFESLALVLNL